MTARCVIRDPVPPWATRVATQEIGGDARFVDEHVLGRIVQRPGIPPLASRGGDIRATLFIGVYGFF
jgi:hypothetical protein